MILSIDKRDAVPFLQQIGMSIDAYGRVVSTVANRADWVQIEAPAEALMLATVARNAVSLLPYCKWALFQFNHASYLDPVDRFQFSRLIFGDAATLALQPAQTLVFSNPKDEDLLILADLVSLSLLHRIHAQLVTSESCGGECISIEDGFLYVHVDRSRESSRIDEALARLEGRRPMVLPSWMSDLNRKFQFADREE